MRWGGFDKLVIITNIQKAAEALIPKTTSSGEHRTDLQRIEELKNKLSQYKFEKISGENAQEWTYKHSWFNKGCNLIDVKVMNNQAQVDKALAPFHIDIKTPQNQ